MEKIRQWIMIISAVSIFSGITSALLPENKLKSAYKVLCGVLFVYAVMLPIINKNMFDFNIVDYLDDNYEISENFDKYSQQAIVDSAEKSIESLFVEYAYEHDIDCIFKVECAIVNDVISITEVSVDGDITENQKEFIVDFAVDSGFEKNIIYFSGEKR